MRVVGTTVVLLSLVYTSPVPANADDPLSPTRTLIILCMLIRTERGSTRKVVLPSDLALVQDCEFIKYVEMQTS